MGPDGYEPPPHQIATWTLFGLAVVVVIGLLSLRLDQDPDSSRDYASRVLPPDSVPTLASWEPPDEEYYPCRDCHKSDVAPNPTRRELEDEHDEMEMAHEDLWCHHCHAFDDKGVLRLADESLVSFDDSWQLCTQCHGEKLADWRAGVHGKRTGNWYGAKEYRTCVACHSPHAPQFPPLTPKPPPRRPALIADVAGPTVPIPGEEVHHEGQ